MAKPKFGWAWVIGEDEEHPDEAWIHIGPYVYLGDEQFLGDEMAVIMCRDYEKVKRENPAWIAQKEADAYFIVRSLNACAVHYAT